jgi:hypothetical protein
MLYDQRLVRGDTQPTTAKQLFIDAYDLNEVISIAPRISMERKVTVEIRPAYFTF